MSDKIISDITDYQLITSQDLGGGITYLINYQLLTKQHYKHFFMRT